MSDPVERVIALKETMGTQGWKYVLESLGRAVKDRESKLFYLMDSKLDELTGKKAISLASGRKALNDFFEDLHDEVRLNAPKPE